MTTSKIDMPALRAKLDAFATAVPQTIGEQVDSLIDKTEPRQHLNNLPAAKIADIAADLLAALEVITDHAQEMYPHFESERGQRDIAAALEAIAKAEGSES